MEVSLDRYREVLSALREAVVDGKRPGYGSMALELAVLAANDLLGDHDAIRNGAAPELVVTDSVSVREQGQSIVIVVPLPVSVTPFAQLCAVLEKLKPGVVLRSVQPGDEVSIRVHAGDMLCDLSVD